MNDNEFSVNDEDIFEFAKNHNAGLFSGDLGFANIVKFPLGSHHGIVILRFPNEMRADVINQIVVRLLNKISESDFEGNLIILSPNGMRIRRG